jgi:hypothetical protein
MTATQEARSTEGDLPMQHPFHSHGAGPFGLRSQRGRRNHVRSGEVFGGDVEGVRSDRRR